MCSVLCTRNLSHSSACPGKCKNGLERCGTVSEALFVFDVETERLWALQTFPNATNKIVMRKTTSRDWEDMLEKSFGRRAHWAIFGQSSGNFLTIFCFQKQISDIFRIFKYFFGFLSVRHRQNLQLWKGAAVAASAGPVQIIQKLFSRAGGAWQFWRR